MPDQSPERDLLPWLHRVQIIALLALIVSTWPLWTGRHHFPQIPWIVGLTTVPLWVDAAALGLWLIGLATALIVLWRPTRNVHRNVLRGIVAMIVVPAIALLVLNQQRLQPWMCQVIWILLIYLLLPRPHQFTALRWLTASIYLWSAVSKLDFTFLQSTGPYFLSGLFDVLHLSAHHLSQAQLRWISLLFPAVELIVGLLLLIPANERWGWRLSLLVHAGLILILGPWGLGHEPGVLIWNAYFIVQNVILAYARPSPPRATAIEHTATWRKPALIALIVGLPALNLVHLADNWPSWAVYAPGAGRVTLQIDAAAIEALPAHLKPFLTAIDWQTERATLRTDTWALTELSAPIYPEDRFRAAVANSCIHSEPWSNSTTLIVESPANRWTGRRTSQTYSGPGEIQSYAESFWWNTHPRVIPDAL